MTDARADGAERRYVAFLSYAHADKKTGRWLHRSLEKYRTPKRLVRDHGAPKRLFPIFRDREELPAGGHLPDRLTEALERSDHLIVLCSPNAAASEWVSQEVATFKALGRGDRIIPVIAEGEPEDAFPTALRFEVDAAGAVTARPDPAERLGADLREVGDGRREGLLKVVAGLIGLGFGEVKQREVEAQRRRTAFAYGLVGLFALISVLAAGSAWVALDRSARLQEALIGILDEIVTDVDDVFARSGTGAVTTAEALRTLERAERQVNIAFGLAPDSEDLLRAEARMRVAFARLHSQAGQREEARANSDRANEIFAVIGGQQDDPGSVWMALGEEANIALSEGRIADALSAYERVLELTRAVGDLRDTSVALTAIGDIRLSQGEVDAALDAYEEGLAIDRANAARDAGNLGYQRDVSVSLNKLADVRLRHGEVGAALEAYEEGLSIRRDLAARDPANLGYQRDLSVSLEKIADVRLRQGEVGAALEAYEEGLGIRRDLAARDPLNIQFRRDVAASLWRLAEIGGTGVTWEEVAEEWEAMAADGILPAGDEQFAVQARANAAGGATQTVSPSSLFNAGEYSAALAMSAELMTRLETALAEGQLEASSLAGGYGSQAWYALFAGDFTAAEAAARRGLELDPSQVWNAGNLAHALMFQDRLEESDALYDTHRGERILTAERLWDEVVAEDFGLLREAGLDHPHMDAVLARMAQ